MMRLRCRIGLHNCYITGNDRFMWRECGHCNKKFNVMHRTSFRKATAKEIATLCASMILVLSACTSVNIDKRNDGSYTANLSRFFSDVMVTIDTPDGGSLTYSSDADTAAAIDTNRLLIEALLARTLPQ